MVNIGDLHSHQTFSPKEGLIKESAVIVYTNEVFLKDKIDTIPDPKTPLTEGIQSLIDSRQIAITEKGLIDLLTLIKEYNQ